MALLDFEYYVAPDGTDHKNLFERQIKDKCPEYLVNLDDIVTNGVEITREEFYTYGLFEDYNPRNPQFSSYKGFREIASDRTREFDSIFTINNTIKFNYGGNTNQQICYAGCGGTLIIANKLFGLNNSNYIRIPERRGRPALTAQPGENMTLDFEYLYSNGERFFRVECKGMQGLGGNITTKANSIIGKKNAQPAGAGDISFGIITQIPIEPDTRNAKCILVDPPTDDLDFSPKDFLFYSKLRFYASRLSNLGNPEWLIPIKEYIIREDNSNQDIENYPYFTINGEIPLKMMFKFLFKVDNIFPWPYFRMSDVFRINDLRVFARVIETKDGNYLLYGFTRSIFETMNRGTVQDFINFKEKPQDLIWKGEVRSMRYRDEGLFLSGNISILSTGEVIGNLNRLE